MIIDGIDLEGLAHETTQVIFPNIVPGRVAHIDADFLAYQCSYEKEGEEKSWDDMCYNAGIAIETLRRMAGADQYILHLTPSASDKGGRYEIALLKDYQANRNDRKNRPRFLDRMREWMNQEHPAKLHMHCEADDGMSEAQYKAIAAGQDKFSIIVSKDKDLMMVPGLHLEWNTGAVLEADAFGEIYIDDTKSSKKLRGHGTKFFWAQMIMGDTVDNISGLPRLCLNNKIKTCGPMAAFMVLNDLTNDKECFDMVRSLYAECGKKAPQYMKNFRDDTAITPDAAFVSEAQLLWMRRDGSNRNCVLNWMVEKCKKST